MLPDQSAVQALLAPYVSASPDIGFAIGIVSTSNSPEATILYAGKLVNDHGQPLDLGGDTYFELASVSKTFCATLFASSSAANPDLRDAVVTSYHPPGSAALSSEFEKITLLSLANYTSGLWPDRQPLPPVPRTLPAREYLDPYPVSGMYSYLSNPPWPLQTASPGKKFSYSNLGFALLGESLQVASGSSSSYGDLLAANVLQPLGMTSTVMFDEVPIEYAGYRSYVTFLASTQPGTVASTAGVFVLTNSAANVDEIARVVLCLACGYLPAPPPSGPAE